ncbi:MAG TPA: 30S ribosome-binding factor RbfA [Acidisarcina sp.]
MPVDRAKQYHRERVAGTLKDEITSMIEGELSDPRISFAYVTQVILNPGGKSALVYIAVDGGAQEEEDTVAGLIDARGYIRHGLLERLGTRHVPDLTFHIDKSTKVKSRIDDLLGREKKRRKKSPTADACTPAASTPDPAAALHPIKSDPTNR